MSSKASPFGTPYQFNMPEQTDEEDRAIIEDNKEALKLFANQNRKVGKPDYSLLLVILPPLIVVILLAIVRGIMP